MRHIRINKLIRCSTNLTLEVMSELLGQQVNPNDKLVISKDHSDMSTEELIEMKNYIHRILNERLAVLKSEYMDLDDKIHNPELYTLVTDENIMGSF
jgi:hypothetical protein